MKGYPGASLSIEQEWFNFRLSSARMAVERAFGMLKGRWRILQRPSERQKLINHCRMTTACVLHNLCVSANVYYNQYWEVRDGNTDAERDEFAEPPDGEERHYDTIRPKGAAKQIQKALCDHMMHNYHVGWAPASRHDL